MTQKLLAITITKVDFVRHLQIERRRITMSISEIFKVKNAGKTQ
jgi:hypothetical protein